VGAVSSVSSAVKETMVTGESDLTALLRGLSPRLNDGCYVYTQVRTGVPAGVDPIVIVREDEGMTLILARRRPNGWTWRTSSSRPGSPWRSIPLLRR